MYTVTVFYFNIFFKVSFKEYALCPSLGFVQVNKFCYSCIPCSFLVAINSKLLLIIPYIYIYLICVVENRRQPRI